MYLDGNFYDFLDSEAYRILFDYGMFKFPLDVYELARKLNARIHNRPFKKAKNNNCIFCVKRREYRKIV